MTTSVQRRRGTTVQHSSFTGLEGEITIDTSKDTAVIHDGATVGGFPLAKEGLENTKTTNLNAITGADTAADDTFLIYDASASAMKKITRAELNNAIEKEPLSNVTINSGSIDGTTVGSTTASSGKFTTLDSSSTTILNGTTIPASKTLLVSTDIGTTVQGYDADLANWALKTAPSGDAVGTTDTQTLTNKTINLTSNTLTGTIAQFNTALSDADFATLAGSESLSNKTITSSSLNSTPVGATTASTGKFTTLESSSTTTLNGTSIPASKTLLVTTDIGTSVQGYDATILKSADIGSTVQAYDAQLADVAGLTPTDNGVIIGNGTNFVVESGATLRTSLGLAIGTDVQAYDADLTTLGAGGAGARDFLGIGTANNVQFTDIAYTGALTGSTGVVNLGSGQFYKDASGNVGIGTSTQIRSGLLSVNGVLSTNNTINWGAAGNGKIFSDSNWGCIFTADRASPAVAEFMWQNAGGTERMRIDSSGNLLVGTTSAQARLTVTAATNATYATQIRSDIAGDVAQSPLIVTKYDNNSTTSQVFQRFAINAGGIANGQINANGASQVAFGSWSDSRLKENIENLPSQINNILSLRPVEFDYITGGHQIGFVAQEMKEVYPDAVGEDSEGMMTITGWDKTTARLVKAIQELNAKVEAQAARIAILETK